VNIGNYFHEFIFGICKIIVHVFMALSTQVRILAIFKLIADTGQLSKATLTAFAFSLFHFWLKNYKRILFLDIRIDSIFVIESDIFEYNHMVTAIHVSVKIRPAKDHSKIFDLSLAHWKLV
jgi:hypothetical protein